MGQGKLSATFDSRTCDTILAIPLNNPNSQDRLTWRENRAQSFSVCSAYQVALRLLHPHQAEHSLVQAHGSTWRRIWKLNVPPKVHNFLWRACSGCLPTRENLQKKRVRVNKKCELCCHHCETICHVLWECPFARNVWALFRGTLQKCSNEADDFFLLFRALQRKLDQIELEKWAITTWSIWNARNRFYFEHVQAHPITMFDSAMALLEEYQRLNAAQRV